MAVALAALAFAASALVFAPSHRPAPRSGVAVNAQLRAAKLRPPSLLTPPALIKGNASASGSRASGQLAHRVLPGALGWALARSRSSDDLLLALVSPSTYALLLDWRTRLFGDEREIDSALQSARGALNSAFAPTPSLVSSISVRTKGLWSTFNKVHVRRRAPHDILALRVVVNGDYDECLEALDAAHSLWPSVHGRYKDYCALPKRNGYRALHDTVILPCGTPMEVQVRSVAMDRVAECGTASHRLYKGGLQAELPHRLLSDIASIPLRPAPRALAVR